MMKEKVLEALSALGFIPEEIDGFGYRFDYEGLTICYPVDEDDDESKCLCLVAPGVFEISDSNREAINEAMVKLCCHVKYVQPNIVFENQVWLNYQHYTDESGVTPDLIEHMIRVLDVSNTSFLRLINENGNDNDD